MNADLVLTFAISNIGFWYFLRRTTHQSAVYTSILVSKWFSGVGMTIFCLFFIFFDDSPALLLIFIGVFLVFLSFVPKFLLIRAEKTFFDELPSRLDMIILAMKSGQSMKNAVKLTNKPSNNANFIIWHAIIVDIETKKATNFVSARLKEFACDFKNTFWTQTKSIESLKLLRRHYSTVNFFRHRSRQATMQARVQSILLGFLFVPAVIYHLVQQTDIKLVVTSIILFACGVFISIKIGRFKKWKT